MRPTERGPQKAKLDQAHDCLKTTNRLTSAAKVTKKVGAKLNPFVAAASAADAGSEQYNSSKAKTKPGKCVDGMSAAALDFFTPLPVAVADEAASGGQLGKAVREDMSRKIQTVERGVLKAGDAVGFDRLFDEP